ncbi:MAG: hypothetical protein GWM92_15755 [Gemmatimonadetes bacterium]|nr:hypothetical protein [Gemmatimonadota bacterium]NIR80187.1 hypothetical protein [Gemmatimonadota bacterium]NIT88949.1 hypothetical protein [Gemmatimonadota bacterium]NIU32744.1 hypothetical protein [Gemmatimonadota bacterium]NIU37176.1 hypothetical protein [Gemmatimonadota bacterium]
MGKTTYARGVYKARVRAGGSAIWIDRTGQNEDLGHVVRTVRAFKLEVGRALEAGRPFSLVVNLGWGEDHDPLWKFVYDVGAVLLVLDDPRQMMQASRIDPDLEELIELGRNREVDILATARRPPELHGSIKNAADVVVVFRQGSRHYAEACNGEWLNLEQGADRILSLPRFHYLRKGEDDSVTFGKVPPT